MKLLPNISGIEDIPKLLKFSNLPQAQELYNNLNDPKKNKGFYAGLAEELLQKVRSDLTSPQGQKTYFERLILQRQSVFESVISKNPRGQILEPGFRIIFSTPR